MAGFQQSIMDQVNVGRAEVQKSVDGVGDVNGGQVPLPLELQVDNDQDLLPLQIEEDDNKVLLHHPSSLIPHTLRLIPCLRARSSDYPRSTSTRRTLKATYASCA